MIRAIVVVVVRIDRTRHEDLIRGVRRKLRVLLAASCCVVMSKAAATKLGVKAK